MKSEETRRLRRDEVTRLDGDIAGRVISCREGILWLTQKDNPGDHLIQAGEAFSIDHPGVVLISALEDSVYAMADGKSKLRFPVWPFTPALWRMARRFEGALRKVLLT
jgi:hypothetical protein